MCGESGGKREGERGQKKRGRVLRVLLSKLPLVFRRLEKTCCAAVGLVKANFEVAGWIKEKGGSSTETIKGLKILSKSACAFDCNGGSGWTGCPVRKCCTEKSIDFCFECADFPCDN
jgi:hypothetical protein